MITLTMMFSFCLRGKCNRKACLRLKNFLKEIKKKDLHRLE